MELAKLIGSPKQIKWAEDIREQNMRYLDAERKELAASISTARWWIDNRDKAMTLDLLKAAVEENEEAAAEEQEAVADRRRRNRDWNEYQRKVRNGEIKQYDIDSKLAY